MEMFIYKYFVAEFFLFINVDWLARGCAELFLNETELEQLHDFEEECMETYYRDKEAKFTGSTDQRIRVINDRSGSLPGSSLLCINFSFVIHCDQWIMLAIQSESRQNYPLRFLCNISAKIGI